MFQPVSNHLLDGASHPFCLIYARVCYYVFYLPPLKMFAVFCCSTLLRRRCRSATKADLLPGNTPWLLCNVITIFILDGGLCGIFCWTYLCKLYRPYLSWLLISEPTSRSKLVTSTKYHQVNLEFILRKRSSVRIVVHVVSCLLVRLSPHPCRYHIQSYAHMDFPSLFVQAPHRTEALLHVAIFFQHFFPIPVLS